MRATARPEALPAKRCAPMTAAVHAGCGSGVAANGTAAVHANGDAGRGSDVAAGRTARSGGTMRCRAMARSGAVADRGAMPSAAVAATASAAALGEGHRFGSRDDKPTDADAKQTIRRDEAAYRKPAQQRFKRFIRAKV